MNANYDAHREIGELYDHVTVYRDRKDVGFYVDLCRAAKGEVLEHLLARAGFEITEFFGDLDRSPFTDSSPDMIVIATRKD